MVAQTSIQSKQSRQWPVQWRHVVFMVLIAAATVALVPQLKGFRGVWEVLEHTQASWLALALALLFATYGVAAATYIVLARGRLSYWRTLLVQIGCLFTGRILPGGIGALGLNYAYLRHAHLSKADSAAMIAVNNTLGFIGNIILLALIAIFTRTILPSKHFTVAAWELALLFTAVLLLIILLYITNVGRTIAKKFKSVLNAFLAFRHMPYHLALALALEMTLSILTIEVVVMCAHAVGLALAFGPACVIMTLGVLGGSATPTPGGIGGAEAALVAGLSVYGVSGPTALATAVVFRVLTYWFGLLLGIGAFVVIRKNKYI